MMLGSCTAMEVPVTPTYDGTLQSLKRYVDEQHLDTWRLPTEIGFFKAGDGASLRYAVWHPDPGKPILGTVVHFNGRTEFIERNAETYSDLVSKGWEVWTLDWRGQGLSDRHLDGSDAVRGYIQNFDEYGSDAERFVHSIVKLEGRPGKHVLLAHSMGAQIALRYLEANPHDFDVVVLTSPLVRLPGGWKEGAAAFAMGLLSSPQSCVLGTSSRLEGSFVGSSCGALAALAAAELRDKSATGAYTHDMRNLAAGECVIERSYAGDRRPGLAVTCPTVGWLSAVDQSIRLVFAGQKSLTMPILIVASENDSVVDPVSQRELCDDLARRNHNCTLVQLPSGHELLIEEPRYRNAFLECFDAFTTDPTAGGIRCAEIAKRLRAE